MAGSTAGVQEHYTPFGGYTGKVSSTVAVYGYGGEDRSTLAAQQAIGEYGAHPISCSGGFETAVASLGANGDCLEPGLQHYSYSTYQNPAGKQPKLKKKTRKRFQWRQKKLLQSAHCEVCKLDFNSQDVLNSHNEGKKHKKKLKKLQDSIVSEAEKASSIDPAGTRETDGEKPGTMKKRTNASRVWR